MAAPPALHAGRGHGRVGAAVDRGRRYTKPPVRNSTPGRLTDGHLKPTRDFHHVDGHDLDILEREEALEILADLPGVIKDSVEVMLEQRVLSLRGRADLSLPEGLAPLHLEYQPGDYERAFTLSNAIDPAGIEARVRGGVLHLRLPKVGPAKRQRIEVRANCCKVFASHNKWYVPRSPYPPVLVVR